ncbi:MAG: SusC/RagA family TonB-linked outer membrane protein, partial [bacterium]
VTVSEKGSTNGTVTDINGNYSIEVSNQDAVLVFSYLGFITKEIQIAGRKKIDVNLESDLQQLDEVIVIGYGTQKKSDPTGALSSVSSKDLEKVPAMNIDQALQGKAAGVEIISNTGAPGSKTTVRIRGVGTLNSGTEPLYVIDGFIMGDQSFGKEGGNIPDNKVGIGFLDPSDIESIEVLKDASAAAIYGSRGANGVILITTKRGKAGKAKVNFDAYRGVQTLYKKYDIMGPEEFRSYWNEARRAMGRPIYEGLEEGTELNETDWLDEVFSPANVESYKLSASGGNESSTFYVRGSYLKQEGMIENSGFDKISFRVNSDHKISSKVKIGENFNLARTMRKRIANEGSILGGALKADPTAEVYDSTGNWNHLFRTASSGNPVGVMERNNYTYETTRFLGSVFLEAEIFRHFTFHSNFGLDVNIGDMESFDPKYQITPSDRSDRNYFRKRHEKWINWDWENTLTYHQSFGDHDLTVMGGVTAQKETFVDTRIDMHDFPFDEEFMRFPNLPTTDGVVNGLGSSPMAYSIFSVLGRALYSYNNKWLLTSSVRRDASSRFGPNYRVGIFPSFSLGYKISEEPFMKDIPYISFIKLRGGWGKLGNQSIPPFGYTTSVYTGTNYSTGTSNTVMIGSIPSGPANPDMHWESTSQTNIGIDAAFFDNKLSATIDGFYKKTTDLLIQVPISTMTGIQNPERIGGNPPWPFVNAAEVENRGIDAMLSYKFKIGDFFINLSGNISHVKNKVLSLAGGEPVYSNDGRSRTIEDMPIASFYGYVIEGIFQSYDEIANAPSQGQDDPHIADPSIEPTPTRYIAPGDFRFKDVTGDGIIDGYDREYIGNPLPEWFYGFNLNLEYKNFDFYASLSGTQGNDILNDMTFYLKGYAPTNKSREVLDHWTPENTDSENPRIGVNRNDNMRFSNYYILDGSYARIKNVTLGYTLPSQWMSKISVTGLRIYATVQNLATFTKYPGMEPEVGSSIGWNPSPLDFGVDNATYPQPRTFHLGVNLSF